MNDVSVAAEPVALPPQPWQRAPVAPWSRWAARSLDSVLVGFVGAALLELVLIFVFNTGIDILLPNLLLQALLVLVVTGLGAAVLYGSTGTTPGKWLFGIRVEARDGGPPGVRRALFREADVLVRGLGLGIPLVSIVTQLVGYRTLDREGESSWDGEARGTVVLYRAPGALRTGLAVLGIVLLIGGYTGVNLLGRMA